MRDSASMLSEVSRLNALRRLKRIPDVNTVGIGAAAVGVFTLYGVNPVQHTWADAYINELLWSEFVLDGPALGSVWGAPPVRKGSKRRLRAAVSVPHDWQLCLLPNDELAGYLGLGGAKERVVEIITDGSFGYVVRRDDDGSGAVREFIEKDATELRIFSLRPWMTVSWIASATSPFGVVNEMRAAVCTANACALAAEGESEQVPA